MKKTLARVEPNSLQLHVLTKPVCDYMHSATAHSDLEVCVKKLASSWYRTLE